MKPDAALDLIMSVIILAFTIPAWAQGIRKTFPLEKFWIPLSLVTLSLIEGLLIVNLMTFGASTLDNSFRFATFGIPLSLLAILLLYFQKAVSAAIGITISCGLSLAMWFFLISFH